MGATSLPTQTQPRPAPVRWPWLLVALAWAVALIGACSGQGAMLDHRALTEASAPTWVLSAAMFLASWQVMILAMMLPSSMPMLTMMIYAARRQRREGLLTGAFLAGYAAIWTSFALLAFASDTAIHLLVERWAWLATHPQAIGAATFALAGVFQFSPLKERCASVCRSPLSFFMRHYAEGLGPAWRLGLRHGLYCLGCCWALMLVLFGVGVGSVAWMAALAGVMVVEKAIPGGQRLTPFVGVALFLLAALWLLQPTWLVATAAA